MIALAYLIAWCQAYFLQALGLALGLLALWAVIGNVKRPAVNRFAVIPLLLLIPFLASVGLFLTDKLELTDNLRGRTVAAYGQDATVQVGPMTRSYRTKKGRAGMYYDVTIRYADGSTKRDNVDLLGVLKTDKNWWSQLSGRSGGSVVLTAKVLPGMKDGWVVTGVQGA